ncbi:hypothetical protein PILCRDRAFT_707 [Piloderma croceum F 1598]|uniref:Uncharacterized protein n=1 Tax=Piloderma croceum (strain F 1598) TaxID=765440 RepID=A0A0C3BYB5_PILCF|nr:hypothetical protein PILCRDRAFT_699 [Piloderma croceum F 1598]KIM91546.1 hypothetical protein PILCRDRAFT_707 [Piloderma croceum F 1598]
MPTGPKAYHQLKELCPVFSHKLNVIWTTDLGPKVCQLLDFQGVLWTSIDVVCFIKVGEGEAVGPVVLWIGVTVESLLGEDAHTSANGCLDLLKEFSITDIEVEFRESIYTPLASPNLFEPTSDLDPDVDICGPLTPALGLSIAAQATPHTEGTGSIYLAKGSESKKVLLITTRHILFQPNNRPNIDYACTNTSAPPRNVLLLSTKAFNNFLDSIKIRIGRHGIMVEHHEQQIEKLQVRVAGEDNEKIENATKQLEKAQWLLDDAREAIQTLEEFYNESKKKWSKLSQRVLGHITSSPPITPSAGIKGFTKDYTIVKLDSSKIKDAFKGNVVNLGTKIPEDKFTLKMYPCIDTTLSFKYPDDRLLPLRDLILEDFMCKPDMLDHDGESCLLVIKNSNATGVTIGHTTKWAILPYNNKSGAFSACGDLGSIITDGLGHIGSILTSGAGKTVSSDITYTTPFFWLLPCIKQNRFPHAHPYPVMASCTNNYGQ